MDRVSKTKLIKQLNYFYFRGEGLGNNKEGIKECIQVRKRDENLGVIN